MSYSSSKEIPFYFDLFRFTLFTCLCSFFTYLYAITFTESFFASVDVSVPLLNASRHQKCIFTFFFFFSEDVLGISAGHLCNKTVEREENLRL